MDPEARRRFLEEAKAKVAGATVHVDRPKGDRRTPAPPPLPEEPAERPPRAPDQVAPWMEWEVERDRLADRITALEGEVARLRTALAAIADQATEAIETPPE